MKDSRTLSMPGFMEGILVALLISTFITFGLHIFSWLLPAEVLGYLLIFITGLGYLLYLFARTREKTGRVTALALYLLVTAGLWAADLSIIWVALATLTVIWLLRSLYYYSSILSAGMDLGLTALSVIMAVAAYLHSGSLFLSIWSLMLIQACFIWIPRNWQQRPSTGGTITHPDRFGIAFETAEAAARKLANQSSN